MRACVVLCCAWTAACNFGSGTLVLGEAHAVALGSDDSSEPSEVIATDFGASGEASSEVATDFGASGEASSEVATDLGDSAQVQDDSTVSPDLPPAKCTPGSCDDGDPCTVDSCDPDVGCATSPGTGAPCTDQDPCTFGDVCLDGTCTGQAATCDDGNACTVDTCVKGTGCAFTPATGGACDDLDPCTTGDLCTTGACGGVPVVCDDQNPCTTDACTAVTGCVAFPASGASCDDANACTANDTCSLGLCAGNAPPLCDDGEACTQDACDPKTGDCAHAALTGGPCSDGSVCTLGDSCLAGKCVPGSAQSCDDADPCTDDSCAPLTGCAHAPGTGAACDDGDVCTQADSCGQGVCVGGTSTCQCVTDADCATLEDADLCNGTLVCSQNLCTVDPKTVKVCNPTGDTTCLMNVCQPATGFCAPTPVSEGESCDDLTVCTTGDLCVLGACIGPVKTICNDGDPCTADLCERETGCQTSPLTGFACDDQKPCTTQDTCKLGKCVGTQLDCSVSGCVIGAVCNETGQCTGGKPLDCDDQKPCTADSCAKGVCAHAPTTGPQCDDGDACTKGETCSAGECKGVKLQCDDKNPCTQDSCQKGQCAFVPVEGGPCDAGSACLGKGVCTKGVCVGAALCGDRPLFAAEVGAPPAMTESSASGLLVGVLASAPVGTRVTAAELDTATGALITKANVDDTAGTPWLGQIAVGPVRFNSVPMGTWLAYTRTGDAAVGGDGSYDVFLAGLQAGTGASIGVTQVVNTKTLDAQTDPHGATLAGDDMLITWTDANAGLAVEQENIKGRLFRALTAFPMTPEFLIGDLVDTQMQSRAVALQSGGFLVAFTSKNASGFGNGFDVCAQAFAAPDGTGVPAASNVTLVTLSTAGAQWYPNLAVNAGTVAGEMALVVWQHDGPDSDVLGRFLSVDGNGFLLGSPFEVTLSESSAGGQVRPAVAAWGAGFAVVWHDLQKGLVMRYVDVVNGMAVGPEKVISTLPPLDALNPMPSALTALTDGRLVAAYTRVDQGVNLIGLCDPPLSAALDCSATCGVQRCLGASCVPDVPVGCVP